MLLELYIENIALIERLNIEFAPGLNVLTGETGAGKSIVVDCLSLALGMRAERDMIRSGEERARVRALFDVSDSPEALACLADLGAEAQDGLAEVARELSLSGRNICRVNGALVPLAKLRAFTGALIDIHGQHEHQALLNPQNHMRFLDAYGGEKHAPLLENVKRAHAEYTETARELNRLNSDASERERRIDMLKYQAREIEEAKLKPDEEAELTQKSRIYQNAGKISEQLKLAYERVYLGGKHASAQESLKRAADAIKTIAPIDARFQALAARLEELYYAVQDTGYELQGAVEESAYDPLDAERVEDRLDQIKRLTRKYGPEITDVLAFCARAKDELNALESGAETLEALENRAKRQMDALRAACDALSGARKELARSLCADVIKQLDDLGMSGTRFEAAFTPRAACAQDGADDMEFMISPNPGEPLRPLSSTASGGELSRIMLALKAISALNEGVNTMIFDEIDSGVSGRMAQTVGEKMCMLGKNKQVICVTHLSQIAALGDAHYIVKKTVTGERTGSSVSRLDDDGRVMELARLVSGADDSASGVDHARRMLSAANALKKRRSL